jgi:excisionase family DNA binding protein
MNKENEIMTVQEAADFLRISIPTAQRHLAEGLIPSFKLGRRRLVPRAELEKLIQTTPQA